MRTLHPGRSRPLHRPTRLALLVWLAWCGSAAHAQMEPVPDAPEAPPAHVPVEAVATPVRSLEAQPLPASEEAPLPLRDSAQLQEALSPGQAAQAPVFLLGDRISGTTDVQTVVEGDATLRKADTVIHADKLEYFQPDDRAVATGNVRINRSGNIYEGPLLDLKVEKFEGFFEKPRYQFGNSDAHGEASRADFIDESHAVVHNATYTSCKRKPGPDWLPDWILRADRIELDNDEEVGVAHGGALSFKGVPIIPVVPISFPLTEKRKSGILPPTLGFDSINGTQVALPYYWNIAPNRDATITPTVMTARGVDMGGEFRYLEPSYSGSMRLNYMAADKLRDTDRWALGYMHQGSVATGLTGVGNIGVSTNINRVSDDNYWKDFTGSNGVLTQRLLPSNVVASWGQGDFSSTVQVHKWQILQDPAAPIVPPYDRLPQVTARYARANVGGLDWSVDGDVTQFESDRQRTLQPNAQRAFTLLQVSRPWLGSAGFFTPKLQWHASSYQFDAALSNGERSTDSVVPTFSLDTGLVFERDTTLFGRGLVQTLEPRAFYVYTPYRNQSLLPNYDTGLNDFNFATIYTENSFGGHDKIADNNLLTLGVNTRLLDADTGNQLARFGLAQRLRYEQQKVTLLPNTAPAEAGLSDVLLGALVNVNDRWALDSTVQYNPKIDQSERSTVGARYSPGPYRVFNIAHRLQRNVSEQLDVSWQWPLNNLWGDKGQDLGVGRGQGEGRYYSVGRMNYSLNEQRLVDSIVGVEYDAGCWLSRVVVQRTYTTASTSTERLMFQLEFVGFTRVGVSPLQTLKQNISRYQNLRDSSAGGTSRFSNYD